VPCEKLVIPRLADVKAHVGEKLGPTEWFRVEQPRIDAFARATEDDQWIHCDVERATRESPWKGTIAHGYLTLSLTPHLLAQLLTIQGWKTAVNTGLDKLRLSSPVPAGGRVRMSAVIKAVRELPRDGLRVTFAVRIEVEGAAKPALLANVNYAYFPD
jgi:acyl dehydratase